jgi:hypothetical protein
MVAKTRRVPDKMNTCKPGKGTKMEKKFSKNNISRTFLHFQFLFPVDVHTFYRELFLF